MKRSLLLFLFIGAVAVVGMAFIPSSDDPIDKLVSSLQKWTESNPQEKVYLHMDKPYYAVGDTIWFKAYVTIGSRHQLSAMSGALYVDLINEKDSLLTTLKLPVTAGMAMGDFTLSDDYKQGNYRIRAYTRWMRNAGEDYFYDHTFAVGDPLSVGEREEAAIPGTTAKKNDKDKDNKAKDANGYAALLSGSDVQFFPEGGNLVNGIPSRVGFKAVSPNGLGAAIKGVVNDNEGKEVTSFESLHAGMGEFSLTPVASKTYRAKLTFADGSTRTLDLPKATEHGYVLSVYQPGADSLLVRINTSAGLLSTGANALALNLVAQSSGEVMAASKVVVSKPVTSIWLLKKDFPTGIAQFTLFSSTGEPLNERIVFIKNKDRMGLKVSTSKTVYKGREKVDLALESKDGEGKPVAGNFSVSVIDEGKVPFEENNESTIFSNILLASDLKGYIEKPNYYFNKGTEGKHTEETDKALDNLMLTQGYRRFSWKEIQGPVEPKSKYKAEQLGTEISGRVLTLSGKPVAAGQVTLMSMKPSFMDQVKTDADGRFRFAPVMITDSIKFAVQARTEKKRNNVELVLDSDPRQKLGRNKNLADFSTNITEITKSYLENSKMQDELLQKTGGLGRVQRLNEVKVKAKRSWNQKYTGQGSLRIPEGHADQTYVIPDAEGCPVLGSCLQGRIHGVIFRSSGTVMNYPYYYDTVNRRWAAMGVIVNGVAIKTEVEVSDIFDNNSIDPADIIKIDVAINNQALVSALGGPCLVIHIKGEYVHKRYNPSIVNIQPKGFNHVREFYVPRYDRARGLNYQSDLRSTIYWNASIKTDSLGRGSFSFFNGDGPGTYKVTIEGINAAGQLCRQVYRYQVSPGPAAAGVADFPSVGERAIISSVEDYQHRLPGERLYLHTDKSYYNLGDTLWFKAYLFDASTLSASKRSGLMYIELNDDTAEAVRRISIPLKNGVGYGQIPLPRKIFHEGGYTLRGYTSWMQNFGDSCFFSRRFYLGVPSGDSWLVGTAVMASMQQGQEQVQVDFTLSHLDGSAVGLREIEVKVMEADRQRYRKQLQTDVGGHFSLSYGLRERADVRNLRAEVNSLNKSDGFHHLQVPLNIRREDRLDLQFLPEGGALVAGQVCRVGFKAIGEDGKWVGVSGGIYDSKGHMVQEFSSLYNGMGSFSFTPIAGESYSARLKGQAEKVFSLPAVNPVGTVLHIENRAVGDSLKVQVMASAGALDPDSSYYVVATSRGLVSYVCSLDIKRPYLSISRSRFPSGITHFTFLRNRTPLNQRMVFVDHRDGLQAEIRPDKPGYGKRDSVSLEITVKDKGGNPVKGNFSLSVTDDSQVIADSTGQFGMRAGLLLGTALKGLVETPGYYLDRRDSLSWAALDNLLLTQGWTGYNWKEVFGKPRPAEFAAEPYFKVSGRVTNITGKPVVGAQLLISSQKPSFIGTALSDSMGRYAFENLPQIDSGSFFIQAKTAKGKKMSFGEVSVDRLKFPAAHEAYRDQQLPWYVNTNPVQQSYVKNVAARAVEQEPVAGMSGIALREVKIGAKKIIKGTHNPFGPGNADLVFDEQDIKESGVMDLYELLKQKVPGFKIVLVKGIATLKMNDFFLSIGIDGAGLPLMIIDHSIEELTEELHNFKIATLRGLEIIYSRKYTNRTAYKDGMMSVYAKIEITTFSGKGWYRINKADIATYRPLPVMHPQEFYSPKYKMDDTSKTETDLRSTIYWKPDIITDAQGKAHVSFYSSDVTGSYTLNLQGSNMDGMIGSTNTTIKIGTPSK